MARQIQEGANLELMLRRFVRNRAGGRIQGGGISVHVHLEKAVAGADSPATGYAPVGEDLRAVIVSVGVVVEDDGHEQMQRRRIGREKRISRLVGLEAMVVA